jgi:hypothetical protein
MKWRLIVLGLFVAAGIIGISAYSLYRDSHPIFKTDEVITIVQSELPFERTELINNYESKFALSYGDFTANFLGKGKWTGTCTETRRLESKPVQGAEEGTRLIRWSFDEKSQKVEVLESPS